MTNLQLDNATSTDISNLQLDTSVGGTHYIVFTAADQAGNVSHATRTVIVGDGTSTIDTIDTTSTTDEAATSTTSTINTTDTASSTPPVIDQVVIDTATSTPPVVDETATSTTP